MNAQAMRPYRQCTRCLMDTSDPEISFDEQGRCNHCTRYFARIASEIAPAGEREARLAAVVERIRAEGRGKDYDCIAGVSGGVDSLTLATGQGQLSLRFFEVFFTLLIFADILIALASIGSGRGYRVVFRNFGFALVTVMLRLGLAAAPCTNAALVVGAAGFAVAISWVFGVSARVMAEREPEGTPGDDGRREPAVDRPSGA